tara:strand:- start:771 stop:2090 length:1320 start_codon:yes stop_codon:yes gene_type:complete
VEQKKYNNIKSMFISEDNKEKFINILFSLIPLSFLGGNLLINLNIILLIIVSCFFFKSEIFRINLNLYDKLISLFFLILLITGIFNFYLFYNPDKSIYADEILIKSFLILRFILIYFIIKFLIIKRILKLKFFFITAAICSLFVSLDVILQFFTGKDIFGYENFSRRNPGPFGDEAISGSYLQRFSLFIFFLFPIFFPNYNKKIYIIFIIPTIILIFCATLFSGNKVPFTMLIFAAIILLVINYQFKKIWFLFLAGAISIFLIFFQYSSHVKYNFGNFYVKVSQLQIYTKSIIDNIKHGTEVNIPNTYIKEIHNGILAFNSKKMIGGGLKSYKISCLEFSNYSCAPHPHNYHVEILVSVGIVGYFLILILFLKFLITFKSSYLEKTKNNQMIYALFGTLFFIEFFPLRTTGSFFSTANITYFFIIMSIAISLTLKKNIK